MTRRELFPVSCSVDECYKAREIFIVAYQTYAANTSREIAIRNALDAVWSNARAYQISSQTQENLSMIEPVKT